ncbi:hypothetical protein [Sulfitobacter phage EE36phi1]|uniref:Uncharacterized protein n=1 Tax=Sulfitobacter phage EE36phi1 TaxID=490913 RepID=C4NTB7_9CAUD|nr:hypothetical protein EE36P1_gp34 [Sulfitobacter phage EE36phi1]ACL81383.1 hypothetical protein [Sulfitobacter phage EE36phi1]
MNLLLGSIASSYNPPAPSLLMVLPAGVPDPIIRYSPEFVTLDVNNLVNVILNQGTGGASFDLHPRTANKLNISVEATWGGKKVFNTTTHTSGGYQITGGTNWLTNAKTFMTTSTYQNGAANFTNFDAIVSGRASGAGNEFEMVGNNGSNRLFGKLDVVYRNGVALATPTSNGFLPLLKTTIGGSEFSNNFEVGTVFYDNFATSRYWRGLTGELMIWNTELNATQVADLHTAMVAFYS